MGRAGLPPGSLGLVMSFYVGRVLDWVNWVTDSGVRKDRCRGSGSRRSCVMSGHRLHCTLGHFIPLFANSGWT